MKAKIGALAIAALMLMVAVPAVSAGPYVAVQVVSAGSYEEARENYRAARDAFWTAHSAWLSARDDFIDARAAWRQDRTNPTLIANVREAHRTCLLKADEMMVKRLQALQARIEATRGLSDNEKTTLKAELDENISWLQAKQTEIQAAENGQQLRSIAIEIRTYWQQVRVWIKQIVGQKILSTWVDAIYNRAEAFAGRIEARIENLKDQGVDTSALESWLADYNSKLTLAKQKYDAAKGKFDDIADVTSPSEARELFQEGIDLIKEGNDYLRDAFKDLREIVSEMRSKEWPITLSGSGTLIAQGNGRVEISGTGKVVVKAPVDGNMMVSPDAEVTTTGGTETVLDNGWKKYQGFDNTVVVGTEMEVVIDGNGIDIVARGTGTAKLVGSGTYSTYGEKFYVDGTWTEVGVTANLGTGATIAE